MASSPHMHPVWAVLDWLRRKFLGVIGAAIAAISGIFGQIDSWPYWPYLFSGAVFLLFLVSLSWAHETVERSRGGTQAAAGSVPIRFLASQIIGRRGDNGEYLLAARIAYVNDGDEGDLQWSAAETLGLSVSDDTKRAENIAQIRAMASNATGPIGTYRLQKGPGTAETPPLTVSKEAYDLYFRGQRTFYFAGTMVVKTKVATWNVPVCGYSPGDPNVVLQCPE